MDIASISQALSSLKAASDIVSIIRSSNTSLDKAEINFRLAELTSALAEAKMSIAHVQQQLLDKDTEISELQQQLKLKGQMVWEDPAYYLVEGDARDGPFCQPCWDDQKKLARLTSSSHNLLVCKVCKKTTRIGPPAEKRPLYPRGSGGGNGWMGR